MIFFTILLYVIAVFCLLVFIEYVNDEEYEEAAPPFLMLLLFGALAIFMNWAYVHEKNTSYNPISTTTVAVEHRNNISIVTLDEFTQTDTSLVYTQSDSAYVDSIQVLWKGVPNDTIFKVNVKVRN